MECKPVKLFNVKMDKVTRDNLRWLWENHEDELTALAHRIRSDYQWVRGTPGQLDEQMVLFLDPAPTATVGPSRGPGTPQRAVLASGTAISGVNLDFSGLYLGSPDDGAGMS